jgi:enediyne biosynthesis protein E4
MTWMVWLLACNNGGGDDTAAPLTCEPNPDSVWAPGQVAFQDATTAWGLDVLMPIGTRIDSVDFDGDGWPDLAVRGGEAANDFSDGGVRTSWLLRNRGDGTFEDVTESSGILTGRVDDVRPGFLWAWGDVDNDGDLDVFTAFYNLKGPETPEIALQDAGTFTLGPEDSDVRRVGAVDHAAGASFLDVDRDGFLDLWVVENTDENGQPAQDRLYLGDGTGRFTDVTSDWGLTTKAWVDVDEVNQAFAHTNAWSGLACDLTNDGLPELLSASYGRAPNHLWTHLGDSFRNDSIASGYAFDGNQDWTDNWSARCWCSLNRDDDECAGVPEPDTTYLQCNSEDDAFRWDHTFDREPFRLGGNSGTTVCADLDNDGWQDLFTTEIVHWDVGQSSDRSEILHNAGDGTFTRPGGAATGVQHVHEGDFWDDGDMTADVFDFDNDGWKDIYLGSSDYPGNVGHLFHQKAPLEFEDMLPEEGIDQHRSHGVVAADFDRDGDLDVVVGHGTSRCEEDCYETFNVRLFENLQGAAGNWLELRLVGGDGSNRAAIGARIDVETDEATQTTEVGGGFGQWGYQDDLVQHFGLGPSCLATVTITWPDDAQTQTTFEVAGGQRYAIVQGDDAPTPEAAP